MARVEEEYRKDPTAKSPFEWYKNITGKLFLRVCDNPPIIDENPSYYQDLKNS